MATQKLLPTKYNAEKDIRTRLKNFSIVQLSAGPL